MKSFAHARGQAMVEYAILITLVVLLVAGGIELFGASVNFYQARSAAEDGVAEWQDAIYDAGGYYGAYGRPYLTVPNPNDIDVYGLGDHDNVAAFSRPSCDPTDPYSYDDGLPTDSRTKAGGHAVYLYNPKPIDITDCIGQFDGLDPTKPRQTALIEALPAVNQALLPLYGVRCANVAGDEVDCTSTNPAIATRYMRLPGKLNALSDVVTLAYLRYDVPATDPYGNPNPIYQEILGEPKPTFELQCRLRAGVLVNFTAYDEPVNPNVSDYDYDSDGFPDTEDGWTRCDSRDDPDDICWDDSVAITDAIPFACDVRVVIRYRHVFYSFLQYPFVYWGNPLPPSALAEMDLGTGAGVLGSEVGRGGVRLFNRTVRWCFESVTTPPTASMKGERAIQSCND